MSGTTTDTTQPFVETGKVEFPPPRPHPCTWQECAKGHKWVPAMALAGCPGCGAPLVAMKMGNCPYCGEPPERVHVRHDYVMAGAGVVAMCKGEKTQGEVIDVEFARTYTAEIEKGEK